MDLSEIPNRFDLQSKTRFFFLNNYSSVTIDEFLSLPGENIPELEFEQVSFSHSLFIIS